MASVRGQHSGLAGGIKEEELDDEAALKWARDDWAQTKLQRQIATFERFEAQRRGRDEGGVVVLDDSDDDDAPPPPPVRLGDARQGSSRGGRAVKKEKAAAAAEDGGDVGDFSALSDFFAP